MTDMTESPPPTSEELSVLVERDKRQRAQQARSEISAICERYRVRLVGTMTVVGDKVETGVMILAD